ncbi:MAG: ABC transporter permease [Micrococcales bacterium]
MLTYLTRRVAQLLLILFVSSYLTYILLAWSGDPLEELRLSSDPKKEQTMIALTRQLDLDTPAPLRYFKWMGGMLGIFWGKFTMGDSRQGQDVAELIATAIPTTIRLVLAATILAMLVGITIGVVTALRQYSRFDYAITFVSFLFFSLPIFWVAVLLKQFLSISFNDWLADPIIDPMWLLGAGLVAGIFWAGVIGGSRQRVLVTFGSAFVATFGVLYALSATNWFNHLSLGIGFVAVVGLGLALLIVTASTGLSNRPALYASVSMVAVGAAIYYPIQSLLVKDFSGWTLLGLAAATIAVGMLAGFLFAKEDRSAVMRTSAITAFVVAFLIVVDRVTQEWVPYIQSDFVSGRPIPTVGQVNDLIAMELQSEPNFWMGTLDGLLHIILPTIALTIGSFAGYVRYTRGNLLEVLNMDYVRTARAKGLTERTVVMRHSFRNALIPLTTLMAWDFAGLIGGAIITESVFGWIGMGTLFRQAIFSFDLNLMMGCFLITSTLAVLANLVSDLLYSALDPRIRVGTGE